MSYQPGLHIIASLRTNIESPLATAVLDTCEGFKVTIDVLINKYELIKFGEVYHNFTPAGFTAVVCLSESHISIHTWPEHGLVNIDIYLSNFQRNNDGTVDAIFKDITEFFNASIISQQLIRR